MDDTTLRNYSQQYGLFIVRSYEQCDNLMNISWCKMKEMVVLGTKSAFISDFNLCVNNNIVKRAQLLMF